MSAEQITPVSGPFKGITGDLLFRYHDGSADVRFSDASGVTLIPREDMPPTFDAYAWPGGYPVAYYPIGTYDITGYALCPTCAKHAWNAAEADDKPEFHSAIEDEVRETVACEACESVIAYQNWCDFCQDSVDTDEDRPHVCKPLKWALQYRYQNTGLPPSVSRYATREQARSMARYYRNRGYQMVNVHQIVPPIMPEQY